MRPCIIIPPPQDYEVNYYPNHPVYGNFSAYNEDGRLICFRPSYADTEQAARALGYEPVPLNSRVGRTISDKVHRTR